MHEDPSVLSIALSLLAVGFLVLLNGFFVAAEFAIVKIRDTQLITLVNKGVVRAMVARRVVSNLDASLSATQLGITLASLGLGYVGEPAFEKLLAPLLNLVGVKSVHLRESLSVAIGFTIITFLHIVLGELAPKSMAITKPLPTTLWVARPLLWFYKLSYPFIWTLNNTSLWLLRRFGIEPASEAEIMHTEEELRLLVASSGKKQGVMQGKDIVLNALDLRRRTARDVMRPRNEITGLDTEATIAECLDVAEKTRYSRFPLCEEGDLDRTLGVVHFKDLYAMRLRARKGSDLLPVARKIIFVPETARLETLLGLFQERKLHLAIVVDEYGGTTGMVTLENILEELVGQIQDEFDQEKPLLEKTGEHSWHVSGALPLHELEDLLGESLATDVATTLTGWITQKVGGFPREGQQLEIGEFVLTVEDVDGVLVSKVRLDRRVKPGTDVPGQEA